MFDEWPALLLYTVVVFATGYIVAAWRKQRIINALLDRDRKAREAGDKLVAEVIERLADERDAAQAKADGDG